MGEPLMTESYVGGGISDPCTTLADDLTDRVEVSSSSCKLELQKIK